MTVSKQIENRIHEHYPDWVFSPTDFLDLGSPHTVGMVLIRMVCGGVIRRLARGLYDFPRKQFLGLLDTTRTLSLPDGIGRCAGNVLVEWRGR